MKDVRNIDISQLDCNNILFGRYKRIRYLTSGLSKINDSVNNPGLRLYKLFKFDFRCEPYLQNVKQFKHRKMFTKLRTNSHLLEMIYQFMIQMKMGRIG